MKSAITLCQVPEAAAGPFVFHDPLPEGFAKAAALGYEAVELFLPSADFVSSDEIKALQDQHGLAIAAVGTGAGMVKHGLSLTDPDPARRQAALDFLLGIINFGGALGAPAILGSMQGKWGPDVARDQALDYLCEALEKAGAEAARHGVSFFYEPLNRYETNLINRLVEGARWLEAMELENITLLADLFHMNIEEPDLAQSLRGAGSHVGHVHFADSNRQAMGFGHTDPAPLVEALREIGYQGYLSAEIFPVPDAHTAAKQTMRAFQSALA